MSKKLLFTHNTNIPSGLLMLNGTYPFLRCCDDLGKPIGSGLNFRHGLDSQYGEIKFIMKPDFEVSKKGVAINFKDGSSKIVPYPFYVDYLNNIIYKGKELENRLEREAKQFGKRYKRIKTYNPQLSQKEFDSINNLFKRISEVYPKLDLLSTNSFREPDKICSTVLNIISGIDPNIELDFLRIKCKKFIQDTIHKLDPYGLPCFDKKELKYSWCNIQLHIGENVPFSDVQAVILPKYLLNLDSISFSGIPLPQFLLQINNSKMWKGNPNPFYNKLYFVGTENYYEYYDYISPLLTYNKYYNKLFKMYEKDRLSNPNIASLWVVLDSDKAIEDATKTSAYNTSKISSTLDQYNKEVQVYLDIINSLDKQ